MLNLQVPIDAVEQTFAVAMNTINSDRRDGAYTTSTEALTAALRTLAAALERCFIARHPLREHHDRLSAEGGPYAALTQRLAALQDVVGVALVGPTPIDMECVNMATRCAYHIANAFELMGAAQLVAEAATTSENPCLARYGNCR